MSNSYTLLVDATFLREDLKGLGRYTYEVIKRLDKSLPSSWKIVLILINKDINKFGFSDRISCFSVDEQSAFKLGCITMYKLIYASQANLLLRFADTVGCRYPIKTMTVCHDINELIYNAQNISFLRGWINKIKDFFRIRSLQQSSVVVCNSN